MFSIKAHMISCVSNYEQAEAHFNKTPAERPPRNGGAGWEPHERPLRDRRSQHLRIEKHGDGDGTFYDICLYRTPMARFYKPIAGKRVVLYSGHDSMSSRSFRRYVLGKSSIMSVETTVNTKVAVPLYNYDVVRDQGADFSARLVFVDGKLDVDASEHAPHYTYVKSADNKEYEAVVKQRFEPWITLAMMRMDEWAADVEFDYRASRPFGGAEFAPKYALRDIAVGKELVDPQPQSFMRYAEEVLNAMFSKRIGNQTNVYSRDSATFADLDKPITPAEFGKSLLAGCLRNCKLDFKTGRKALPMFMPWDDYPRSTARPGRVTT